MFLAESRERSSKDGMSYGSLVDYESQKIFQKCSMHDSARNVLLYEMIWFMPVSPWIMDGSIW